MPTSLDYLGSSPDVLAQRKAELLRLLRDTCPECIADNQLNLDALKMLFGDESIAKPEHYELSWAGKSAARREIQKTTTYTLNPSPNNPERAQHILIEGDNLEVLRVLQRSYYGKVKMIYIDPPYNTGNDSFIYPDDYSETLEEYLRRSGEKNAQGFLNKQSLWKKNSKENGQYHSVWLSMMYPRLYLARNLLRDDGVIFISIDDNEAANLKLLCDEIFGEENFISQLVWKKKTNGNNVGLIPPVHDYIIVFAKSISKVDENNFGYPISNNFIEKKYSNPDNDPRGPWNTMDLSANHVGPFFGIKNPITNHVFFPPQGRYWVFNEEEVDKRIKNGRIIFGKSGSASPVQKVFLNERKSRRLKAETWWDKHGLNADGTEELANVFNTPKMFVHSKPSALLKNIANISSTPENNEIILDFFAGSGTTAHAVMELNAQDGGNRQSISVQIAEPVDKQSEAYKAGYRTIADITRARIEKVIAKLKAEQPDKTSALACAYFTLAPSNFKVWGGDLDTVEEVQRQLDLHQKAEEIESSTNINNSHIAMLAELLLKNGLGALGVHAISELKTLDCGLTIHCIPMNDEQTLWVCFTPYQDALKAEISKQRPAQVIMLNSCFNGENADEQLSNLKLELEHLEIGLLII